MKGKQILSILLAFALFLGQSPSRILAVSQDHTSIGQKTVSAVSAQVEPEAEPVVENAVSRATVGTAVNIDSSHFPDYHFCRYLYDTYDADKNWQLSAQEVAAVTEILAPDNIANLKGVEYFYNLEKLFCIYENVTEVDLSGNPKLNYLTLQGCPIKKLDLSNNPLVTYVSCGYNGTLEELNITGCKNITSINAWDSKLKALDVRHCSKLKSLNVEYCNLQTLLLGTHPYLTSLYAGYNQLKELNLSGCANLGWLMLGYNQLESLDLSNVKKLQYFECNTNFLTSLNLSGCTNIQRSQLAGNVYTISLSGSTFDLSTLPGFDVSRASNWVGGTVSGNTLTVDPSAYCVTYDYKCSSNRSAGFTLLFEGRVMPEEIPINNTNFPDYLFRSMISSELDLDKNGKLSYYERARTSEISNGYGDYKSVKGIEYFFNTEFLFLFGALLTEIDLSGCPWLVYVDLGQNNIKKLDVSNHKQLNYLSAYHNDLTEINVSGCYNLVNLELEGNQLTTLSVRGLSKLQNLDANNNQLTSITFYNNGALKYLDVSYNKLTQISYTFPRLIETIYVNDNQLTSLDVTNCVWLTNLNVQNNQLTELDLTQNRQLKWLQVSKNRLTSLNLSLNSPLTSFDHAANRYEIDLNGGNTFDLSTLPGDFQVSKASNWTGGTVSGNILTVAPDAQFVTYTYTTQYGYSVEFVLDVTGRTPDTMLALNATNFPDSSFRQFLSDEYDLDKDGYLSYLEIAGVTQIGIRITGTNPCSFEGIQHFFNLEQLNIGGSPVYELDLSGNPKLSEISIYNTYISQIDLSNNPLVDYFACWDCPISEIDFSNNPDLRVIYVCGTKISELDLRNQTKLQQLYAYEMPNLHYLDVSNCTNLQLLSCEDSALETLILGNHPALEYLHCQNNQIKTLDLTGCSALTNFMAGFNQLEMIDLSATSALSYLGLASNRLTSINMGDQPNMNRFESAGNSLAVRLGQGRTIDLNALPGNFDVTKISNIQGAVLNGSILTVDTDATQVAYTYDCGSGYYTDFVILCSCPGHSYTEWQPSASITCTTGGEGSRSCIFCGDTQTQFMEALGHDEIGYDEREATCMDTGWNAYVICSRCDYTTFVEIPAKGHTPASAVEENRVGADCTNPGSYDSVVYCTECHNELSREEMVIPALGHDEISHAAQAPTCTEIGWNAYVTCSRCDHSTYVEIPAKGHKEVTDPAVAPTCTEPGLTEGSHCSVCGEVLVAQQVIPASDHCYTIQQQNTTHSWFKCQWCVMVTDKTPHTGLEKRPMLQYTVTPHTTRACEEIMVWLPRENGYLRLNFDHMISPNMNYNVWINYEMQACDDALNHRFWLTNSGAVEAAIRIDGRDDFSGGVAHGDEIDMEFYVEVDGVRVDFSMLTALTTFTELKIIRRSTMYDPADHTTEIAIHDTEYLLTADGMQISQKVTWLIQAECNYSYMAMFPVLRTTTDANGNTIHISEFFYNDVESNHYDVQESGKSEYPQRWNYGASKLTLYSNTMGLTHTLEILEISDVPGAGYSMCSNSTSYNKLYFTIAGAGAGASHVAKPGDEWITVSFLNIEIGQENRCYYGHSEVLDKAVPPTCTTTGLTEGSHCSACGEVLVAQMEIPAIGHSFGAWTQVQAPTCTVDGSEKRTCACGHSETRVISKLGHNYTSVVTAPTCTAQGYTTHTCSRCNDTYVDTYVNALGHDHSVEVPGSAKAPTCTEPGKNADMKCSRCDDVMTGTTITATGHKEVIDAAVAPTCTTTGLTEGRHCETCGEILVKQQTVPATGHNSDMMTSAVAPTCTATGLTEGKKCSVCGEIQIAQNIVPALGHDHSAEVPGSAKAPTCTEPGKNADMKCSRCDDVKTGATIAATGHKEIIDTAVVPTCTTTGLTEGKHCETCGEILVQQTEVAKLAHVYGAYVQTTAPTCTTKGEETAKCVNCDATTTREVAMIAHAVEKLVAVAPTCTTTGLTEGKKCSVCQKLLSEQEVVAALGHDEINHAAQAPTCTEIGWNAYVTCSRCDYTTYVEILAKGHTPASAVEENRAEPTCTENGSYDSVVYCAECNTELSRENKTMDALGHTFGNDGICDRCGFLDYIPGDLDENEIVDGDDVVYLLMYTFFPEDYPMNQVADFDHNGIVDGDDVVYLLMHTFFPDDYPLT